MTLEDEICDSLQDLKYPQLAAIESNVSLLTDLSTFSSIISWISQQLIKIENFESNVNPIKDESEMVSFKIELNSLLREINCPLIDCSPSEPTNRLSILNSLCGELLSSRINYVNQKMGSNQSMTIAMNESQTAKDLKTILMTLGMGRPPNNIGSEILFKKIREKLVEKLSQRKQTIEDSLLLPESLTLSPEQWKRLENINEDLIKDYTLRREMLLRRLDCTISAFKWKSDNSNDMKDLEKRISETYQNERQGLSSSPNITLSDALAARQSDCNELLNGVVSNSPTNCVIRIPATDGKANKGLQQRIQMSELHKYRIGSVPDRGGRPNEQPKPPKESFTQQQFQRDNPQRGRGRGGAGGGGGGRGGGGGGRGHSAPNISQNTSRVQGTGWSQSSGDRYSSSSGYDNQNQMRGQKQNYNNYHSGQQERHEQRDYQQNTGYYSQQQPQQHWGSTGNYQNNQHIQQQYDNQSYNNYSNQSYYGNDRQQSGGTGYRGRRY